MSKASPQLTTGTGGACGSSCCPAPINCALWEYGPWLPPLLVLKGNQIKHPPRGPQIWTPAYRVKSKPESLNLGFKALHGPAPSHLPTLTAHDITTCDASTLVKSGSSTPQPPPLPLPLSFAHLQSSHRCCFPPSQPNHSTSFKDLLLPYNQLSEGPVL